jgi:transposase-like protein
MSVKDQVPGRRRRYSSQFKAEAVQLVVESGRPISHVAKDLGVGAQLLGRWVQQYRAGCPDPDRALSPVDAARLAELEDEMRKLRLENEFLKKAAAFFARTLP